MNMIVAYDIANPRRLLKVAKIMKDYGLRVQKSIFEVEVTEVRFREMKMRAEAIIHPLVDGVKYFPLCDRCADTVECIGIFSVEPENTKVLVI